jgi:MoxR-like ATPase
MVKEKRVDHSVEVSVNEIEKEVAKIMVGQKEIIRDLLRAVICDGHVLLEGVPGVAKTVLIKALSHAMGCDMKRVQFTVDLLPTDILGITKFNEKRNDFEVIKGPIFSNFLIADEINRSPAKTQSALLEAMQEKKVTIGKVTYNLSRPFIVLATENPIEQSGVYSLPEAQLDRFLFKVIMKYPSHDEEKEILHKNTTTADFEDFNLKKVLNPAKILALQKKVKDVYCSEEMKDYIVRLIQKTRSKDKDFSYSKYVSFGASPRASISIFIAAKAEALINGRNYVIPTDVKAVIYPVLRHRILLNYEAEADNVTTDMVIEQILKTVDVK